MNPDVTSVPPAEDGLTVWTIGHSTRSAEDFLAVLAAHRIELMGDVRRFPGSRRLPQFQQTALEHSLASAGIAYRWIPELGGRRSTSAASAALADADWPTSGWRHAAFRAYAAHVATAEFREGLATLVDVAYGFRTVIMCAEVLWWRCHRRLVSDVLVATGHAVVHIRDATHAEPHRLAAPAQLIDGWLSYASAEADAGPEQRR